MLGTAIAAFTAPAYICIRKEMVQDHGFTEDQKQYLEGFITAIVKKHGPELPRPSASVQGNAQISGSVSDEERQRDPTYAHAEAQDRAMRAGGQLAPEELAKREKHPFDMWDEMLANAGAERFPKGLDVFRYKFHGLFYAAPNQDAFMLRLRLPGGILSVHHAKGLCAVAEQFGGGHVDVTTRANLQIREIGAAHSVAVLEAIQELGLTSRGAGADNIRNIPDRSLLCRCRSAGRAVAGGPIARTCGYRRALRFRHDPADGLAEPADLRHRQSPAA